MTTHLDWPLEAASTATSDMLRWSHAGSNVSLDFHGDPVNAELVVFSDGNHHMALQQSLQTFLALHPEVNDIFYATTPPSVIMKYLKQGSMRLGNLTLSRQPHVFISPPNILTALSGEGFVDSHQAFIQSRGNVLLVRKDNPKQIHQLADLLRDDVTLFISNPLTEKASYDVYHDTILALAEASDLDAASFAQRLQDTSKTVFGECIHHREAPQNIHDGRADVALVYYHLALRYTRIFPELFELVPLDNTLSSTPGAPEFTANNVTTTYHIGLVGDGGKWGQQFLQFMLSDTVANIYREHGLQQLV